MTKQNQFKIRPAEPTECRVLTDISFQSKRYWHDPPDYFKIWRNELTITSEYITSNDVFVYEHITSILGFYSLVDVPEDTTVSGIEISAGLWLDHMFVSPPFIGKGIGKAMFLHCLSHCHSISTSVLRIFADPNARVFYEKQGCQYIQEVPSTIPKRTTPYLEYHFK